MSSSVFESLASHIGGPDNPSIEAAKAAGMPVVGYMCNYVPIELLWAGGILPIRMRGVGASDSSLADVYLSGRSCTYVRHTMNLVLEGRYDFLDGEVSCNSCDHVRRAADLFRHKTTIAFHGFLSVPRATREDLLPWFVQEVKQLSESLQRHFDIRIDDDRLREAIATYNSVRRCLVELSKLQQRDEPVLTGAQMLSFAVAARVMAPQDFIDLAEAALDELQQATGQRPRARLLLAGGMLEEPEFVEVIESQGGLVVGDQLCCATRWFSEQVPESGDPLQAICRSYLFRLPCARMIGDFERRLRLLKALATELDADGIVFQRIKFCDPWGGEAHHLRSQRSELGFPLLVLDREYGALGAGQVRTRVQAFLESIGR